MGRLFIRQAREREQDDELLSAYLDGELSAGERARLEARLATDPALRAELDALRRTAALVHDLPTVPVPRNFILPQTMVARPRPAPPARPRRAWAAPLLTAATAVASLLFVVVLAGDLLLSGVGGLALAPGAEPPLEAEAPQPQALAPSPISEEVEVEKAMPAVTVQAVAAETPPEAVLEAPAEAEGYDEEKPADMEPPAPAMDSGGEPSEESTVPAPTASPPVAEEAAVAPAALTTPEGAEATVSAVGGGGPGEESTAHAPTLSPPVAEEAAAAPTALATATAMPERYVGSAEPTPSEVGEVAPRATGEEAPEAAEGGRGAPESEVAERATTSRWRTLEVILGLTTLGLALATVWAWRVRRQ